MFKRLFYDSIASAASKRDTTPEWDLNAHLKFNNSPIPKHFQVLEEKAFWNLFDLLVKNDRIAFGPDLYFEPDHTEAVSAAQLVSACVGSPFFISGRVQNAYRKAVDWLIEHHAKDADGYLGWGMTGPWSTGGRPARAAWTVNYFVTAQCLESLVHSQLSKIPYRRKDVAQVLDRVSGDVLARGAKDGYFCYSPRTEDHGMCYYVNATLAYALYLVAVLHGGLDRDAGGAPLRALIRSAARHGWNDPTVRRGICGYSLPDTAGAPEPAAAQPAALLHGVQTLRALYFLNRCGMMEQEGPGASAVIEAARRYIDSETIKLCEYPAGVDGRDHKTARLPGVGVYIGFLKEIIGLADEPVIKDSLTEFRCFALNVLFTEYTDRNLLQWRYSLDHDQANVPRALAYLLMGLAPFAFDPKTIEPAAATQAR